NFAITLRSIDQSAVAHDGLQFEIVVDAEIGIFAPVARLLEAAERRANVPGGIVEIDRAGAQPRRDRPRMTDIRRRHVGREAVDRVVGDADRLVFVPIARDREHRTEHLLPFDRHAGLHVAEHGRPDVVSLIEAGRAPWAAGDEPRPFADPGLDETLDLVELGLADDRSEIDAGLARMADLLPARDFGG